MWSKFKAYSSLDDILLAEHSSFIVILFPWQPVHCYQPFNLRDYVTVLLEGCKDTGVLP